MTHNIAFLASGNGSTFEKLTGIFPGKVKLLIVDRPCHAIERAFKLDIPCCPLKNSEDIFEECRKHNIHLVCLAGWLRKLTIPFDFSIDSPCSKVMNIHPSLLPSFGGKGMYGLNVHKAVCEAGVRVTGCTVHFVDNEYDHGPIILQRAVGISTNDTPEMIQEFVKKVEPSTYAEAIGLFLAERVTIESRKVKIKYG